MNKFSIAKVRYVYTIEGKTATITREDGAHAQVRDDENEITDWKNVLMEMVANDNLFSWWD